MDINDMLPSVFKPNDCEGEDEEEDVQIVEIKPSSSSASSSSASSNSSSKKRKRKTVNKSLAHILECSICLEPMYGAMTGVCGHSLCGLCVSTGRLKTCPQCRKRTKFAPNITLRQVVEETCPDGLDAYNTSIRSSTIPGQIEILTENEEYKQHVCKFSNVDKLYILQQATKYLKSGISIGNFFARNSGITAIVSPSPILMSWTISHTRSTTYVFRLSGRTFIIISATKIIPRRK